jgi:hypothetical protein
MSDTLGPLMQRNLLDGFGQPDSARRAAAIYAANCTFFESGERIVGRDALNARIERILQEAPGFVFRATAPAEVNHDLGRLQWHLGPPWSSSCRHRHGRRDLRARANSGAVHLSRQACE